MLPKILISTVLIFFVLVGVYDGVWRENNRIYSKCLVELNETPYADAVSTCKKRVE